jgi:hypothetical protein
MHLTLECRGMNSTSAITTGRGHAVSIGPESIDPQGIRSKIAVLWTRHNLNANEVQRLWGILDTWSSDLWGQGVDEELTDILAARELSKLKPLTLEDARELQKIISRRGEIR